MDKLTLLVLLEDDKEMIMSNLARDRAPQAAVATLDKAVDRVMYRYMERCGDPKLGEAAQLTLQTLKSALPLMDAVGDVREWKKHVDTTQTRRKMDKLSAIALAGGALLVGGAALGLYFSGRLKSPLTLIEALLPLILGGAGLFWSGLRMGRPAKKTDEPDRDQLRIEYLIDTEKAWHDLRGAMLMADSQLEVFMANAAVEQTVKTQAAAGLSGEEIDLLTNLLELAYVEQGDNAREMISGIRFFLHARGIDMVEYSPARAGWFEKLPAQRPGTIRPALACGEKLIKKGLASA